MPRTTGGFVRHRYSLPVSLLTRMRERSSAEVTPAAEYIRRVIDLLATFDFNSPAEFILDFHDAPAEWFNLTLPPHQIQELINVADARSYPPDIVLAGALAHYLDERDKACPIQYEEAA